MTTTPAHSTRRRASLGLALAGAIVLLALAPSAYAYKKVDRFIGSPTDASGTDGGRFNSPQGIAINQAGAGGVPVGEFYVVDSSNRRVQEFSPAGAFVRSWGADVIKPGAPNDTGTGFEVCDTTAVTPNVVSDCKAGSNAVSVGGAMSNVEDIAVDQSSGAVYVADWSLRRIQKFTATGEFLAAFGWDVQVDGVTTFEVCTASANCKGGSGGNNAGQLGRDDQGGDATGGLAVGPSGDVYIAEPDKRRIQQFKGTGDFVSAWGWDVIPLGKPGDLGTSVYERCPASAADTAGDCMGGPATDKPLSPGHFGAFIGDAPGGIAVNSTGKVFASDGPADRIHSFDANGGSPVFLADDDSSSFGFPGLLGIGALSHIFVHGQASGGRIFELDSAGKVLDSHMRNSGLSPFGLAVNQTTGDLYVSSSNRVFVLDDDGAQPNPTLAVTVPSVVGAHNATFEGTINPNGPIGIPTEYHFEYSRNGSDWKSVSGTPLAPADGVGVQNVSAAVSGLEANAVYQVRLVGQKAFGATEAVTSPAIAFLTEGPGPEVKTLQAQNFSDTAAVISATVNPNNRVTSYRFEYGESTAYGKQAPLANGELEGGVDSYISEQIEGLEPETTYHFRIVAENESGEAEGKDRTFTTRTAFAGFEPRAFEQVSPRRKVADVAIGGRYPPGPTSADGGHKLFRMTGVLDDSIWGGQGVITMLAHRRVDGWSVEDIEPRPLNASSSPGGIVALGGAGMSKQLVTVAGPVVFGPSLEVFPDQGLYLHDSVADSFELLAPYKTSGGGTGALQGVPADISHAVFNSGAVFTSDPDVPPLGVRKVYEWTGGQVRLVSVGPDGLPLSGPSGVGSGLGGSTTVLNAVSADGSQVFFSNPLDPTGEPTATSQIYRRDNGTVTIMVSASKRTPTDPLGPQARTYLDATLDQSEGGSAAVFFASQEKLTNVATNTNPDGDGLGDLYRYEVNTDTLTNISAETNDLNGAEVLGMLGRSEDGNWVYYVAKGQVLAGQGELGQPNLYVWHDDGSVAGETRLVGTLANSTCSTPNDHSLGDGCNWTTLGGPSNASASNAAGSRTARVSSDGKTLLFQASTSLTGYPTKGLSQLYLYEADGNGGNGQLSCIACDPNANTPTADTLAAPAGDYFGQDPTRSLADDGSRAFFQTFEALLPGDVNDKLDVYEWSEGHLQLISSGKSGDDSRFEGASASGDDVFFTTRDQLVGVDDDQLVDLYDARVGGGFASQNPPPPGVPCVGEACKPSPAPQPVTPATGSSGFSGPGNEKAKPRKPRCRSGFKQRTVKGKRKCVKPKRKRDGKKNQHKRTGGAAR